MADQLYEFIINVVPSSPLPSMETANVFQAQWSQECILARRSIDFALRGRRKSDAEAVADVMIDRGVCILSEAPSNKIRHYASIGILRFVEYRLHRFQVARRLIFDAFKGNPTDTIRERISKIDEMIWRERG
jgi:hypothetical protein